MSSEKAAKIAPYLTINGAEKALAFYQKAFDAVTDFQAPAADNSGRLMHATVSMFGAQIMLHDEFPEIAPDVAAPKDGQRPSVTIHINLDHPADVDAVMAKAEAAGATITVPPADMFWGARYGRLRDPFGHAWAFAAEIDATAQEAR